ncbi:3-deoxy-7-phosphoheptulonate synthase [Leadbettera azotonutricia]|uniref:3-deoxy-7-phosphoheptulonate synthase n=1 Tax=Leadbettera azotonutricia (strain ATCC BAA-888 / DSM 13862 / ZAS-9) TaxID=545695 RepID=F5YFM2_LEAAZ|nr:3-deoxy-7-phosphoheptulonate synthase [Leadbettera azotonutricia]AEF80477.1 3-deoxy-7-phosphoheptulonate synthase [Leadbettera azotonutricia ZAS-9]
MIIAIKRGASSEEVKEFSANLEKKGVKIHLSEGAIQTIIGLVGDTTGIDAEALQAHHLVEKVIRVQEPYKRANRLFHPEDSRLDIALEAGGVQSIGGGKLGIIAGPCSVETREQIVEVAVAVKKAGAGFLRGGVFKPRTSPYSFQGLGFEGLDLLLEAKKASGLPIVTELMAIHQLELFDPVDIIQIGARNMQNFTLLKELGHCRKPILLKRGYACTVTELLMAAEYIMAGGNDRIILCERGIRTYDTYTRNTLDLAAIPFLKKQSHLPVIVDPSHGTGFSWMVPAMAKAAIAAGADGLIIEVHNNPEKALCDGEQSITPAAFAELMEVLRKYAAIEGKTI